MSAHESAILKEDVLTIKHDTVDAFSTVSKTTQVGDLHGEMHDSAQLI